MAEIGSAGARAARTSASRDGADRAGNAPHAAAVEPGNDATTGSPYVAWLARFAARRDLPLDAPWTTPVTEAPGRAALVRSIARFELGESGAGDEIQVRAARLGGAYAGAIGLFTAEESAHAAWLGRLRGRFGGAACPHHWTATAFVALRRALGLRTEVLVLLAAEVVALSYYRLLSEADDDPALQVVCSRILDDERVHVAFHVDMLGRELPPRSRHAVLAAWRGFVAGTAAVVAWDHRAVLAGARVSRRAFVAEVRAQAAACAGEMVTGPA
ncbi:MAG: ferritin-like domain-containing protein [Thermoleophilia bacterium]